MNRELTLAEHWNGSSWHVQTTPNAGGANDANGLTAVSCPAAGICTAVGNYLANYKPPDQPFAERLTGSGWHLQPTPNPHGGSELAGVACPARNACTAVGSYLATSSDVPVAERWDGMAWKTQQVPSRGTYSSLSGVVCFSASSCLAVGADNGSDHLLAERYG
jgi:hypothetical protein